MSDSEGEKGTLQACNTLWIGESLSPIERACLRSMTRVGHEVRLFCYDVPRNLPEGVETVDARELLPEHVIVLHRTGSPALFSDWFRYEVMRRSLGLWVDTDMYLLRPVVPTGPYVVGEQEPGVANGAVLLLPPDSPLLPPLIAIFRERSIPAWLPPLEKAKAWARRAVGPSGVATMPWGTAGPHALTALLKKEGLWDLVLPREAFYPVDWRDALWVLDPSQKLEDKIGESTIGIHLWSSRLASFDPASAPKGSFMARLALEGR